MLRWRRSGCWSERRAPCETGEVYDGGTEAANVAVEKTRHLDHGFGTFARGCADLGSRTCYLVVSSWLCTPSSSSPKEAIKVR